MGGAGAEKKVQRFRLLRSGSHHRFPPLYPFVRPLKIITLTQKQTSLEGKQLLLCIFFTTLLLITFITFLQLLRSFYHNARLAISETHFAFDGDAFVWYK